MTKNEFLNLEQTQNFVNWFAEIVRGEKPLVPSRGSENARHLNDVLLGYAWPSKRVDIPTPKGGIRIDAWSDFAANEAVLLRLAEGIKSCLHSSNPDNHELAGWAQAIMVWGGVFTRVGKEKTKGNGGWLKEQETVLATYLRSAIEALKGDDDTRHRSMENLRSNAGTTKIHSLLLPDFVIYDSRVAASLAWLVQGWASENNQDIPAHLKFACMRANTSKAAGKRRSPNEELFKYFVPSGHVRNHHKHATWNIRANWVIGAAIEQARTQEWNSRKVEAALFMLGDDLSSVLNA